MSTENTERPTHGTATERLPGGRIVIRYPSGKVVDAAPGAPVTVWPSDDPPPRTGKQ
jgi:hypothetical protein